MLTRSTINRVNKKAQTEAVDTRAWAIVALKISYRQATESFQTPLFTCGLYWISVGGAVQRDVKVQLVVRYAPVIQVVVVDSSVSIHIA